MVNQGAHGACLHPEPNTGPSHHLAPMAVVVTTLVCAGAATVYPPGAYAHHSSRHWRWGWFRPRTPPVGWYWSQGHMHDPPTRYLNWEGTYVPVCSGLATWDWIWNAWSGRPLWPGLPPPATPLLRLSFPLLATELAFIGVLGLCLLRAASNRRTPSARRRWLLGGALTMMGATLALLPTNQRMYASSGGVMPTGVVPREACWVWQTLPLGGCVAPSRVVWAAVALEHLAVLVAFGLAWRWIGLSGRAAEPERACEDSLAPSP